MYSSPATQNLSDLDFTLLILEAHLKLKAKLPLDSQCMVSLGSSTNLMA